ncbi:MAG: metallophosphoesterase [Victivallales bacterium]|nr:metallophosphoesterase [Victivallales bacterium]
MRVRIAHFSDLHLWRSPGTWRALLDKRALGCANHLLRRRRHVQISRLERAAARMAALAPDWVVCTGDLTTTGSPAEFEAACEAVKPLMATALRGSIYVPGNHDAYVRDVTCRRALAEACAALNGDRGTDGFPQEVTDRGLRMLLLDEAGPSAPWQSSGRLKPDTMHWLGEKLGAPRRDGEARILVGHFPLLRADGRELSRRRRLAGAEELVRFRESGAYDVALCGHIHQAFRRDDSACMELCAGSLTMEGKINVLDFFPESCTFSQFWLDMSDDQPSPVLAGGQVSATGAR